MIAYTEGRTNAWVTSCAGPGTVVSACGRYKASRVSTRRWVMWPMHDLHCSDYIAESPTVRGLLPVLARNTH